MKSFFALTLLLWSILNAADKGGFLAAVEGFSARGLARPWDHSNNKRLARDVGKKKYRVIRFYVNEEHELEATSEDTEGSASMKNKTQEGDEIEMTSKASAEDDKESFPGLSTHKLSSGASVAVASTNSSVLMTASTSIHPLSHGYVDHSLPKSSPKLTVRSCLPDLWAMTRPSNLPAVFLFHMLGTYLAVDDTASYWSILFKPSMMITLVALLLTSSTSMLVNDYYDFKLGHDSNKPFQPLNTPSRLPLNVAKRFLSYLYAAALVCVAMVPGVPARLAVVMGLMLTFWYTQHLKPRTWLKNAVCASLIALSPLTSGVAAVSVAGTAATAGWSPLLRVVSMLFVGILGREITMDINDVQDDSHHGVRTVPVVYGTKFASAMALTCSVGVAGLALVGPLGNWLAGDVSMRRILLAVLGGALQFRRGWQVFRTEGRDPDLVQKAVEEGLLTVVLLLASFV